MNQNLKNIIDKINTQMNLKTKKNIAKETIYFFSTIAILLAVWTGIEIRNFYLNTKIDDLNKEVLILKNKIETKQNKIIESEIKNAPVVDEFGIPVKFKAPSDGKTLTDKEKLILINQDKFDLDKLKKEEKKMNQHLYYSKNKLISKQIVIWCAYIFFGLLYPIRYVFKLLKWSFKTIKS